MTARAREWSTRDPDRRFGLGPPRDEITGLASTLDDLLGRLSASMRHETWVTSQVAHELRAPLTRLRAVAEFSVRYDTGAEPLRAALGQVIGEVDQLTRVIETLLKAHGGAIPPGQVDIAAAAARVTRATAQRRPDLHLSVHGMAGPALCDPEVAERILAPLVDNATRYARTAVTLAVGDTRDAAGQSAIQLDVLDDGPGFAAAEADAVFEPGYRGAAGSGDGAGLGLPLARRLARLAGGDVTAVPEPRGHVVVVLPALPDSDSREVRRAPSP